ncbi:MAG: shikimate kinase [Candidatus Sulfotelmatobacter sp.]
MLGPSRKGGTPAAAIFLVGFMGAGKSTVGQALGRRLDWVFEDLDQRIERRENRSVAEIFRDSGEEVFRQAERAALREVLDELRTGVPRVVALGGGAFAKKENAALLKAFRVPTIFLDGPVEELWRRCSTQADEAGTQRPLLRSWEQFSELYEARRRSYSKALLKIQTGSRPVKTIVDEIAEALGFRKIATRTEQGDVE